MYHADDARAAEESLDLVKLPSPSTVATLRTATSLAAGSGRGAKLSVLIYHRVLETPDPLAPDTVDAALFAAQMEMVRQVYNVLPLVDAIHALRNNTLPRRALSITFDDGYTDNATVAFPILCRLNLPATFFIATRFIDGGCMWNDRINAAIRCCSASCLDLTALGLPKLPLASNVDRLAAVDTLLGHAKYLEIERRSQFADDVLDIAGVNVPDSLMMTSEQIKILRQHGMHIGAHTCNHPILNRLSRADARREIVESKQHLENLLSDSIDLFAYPNGRPGIDYTAEHVSLVREAGFQAAVSTAWGFATSNSDFLQLPRFTPWDNNPTLFSLRLIRNLLRRTASTTA